jgi:hypothetical protein
MGAQGDLFGSARPASDLNRSSALTALSWSSIAFLSFSRRSDIACNSASVIPANEGSRALRRAPRVSERIHATNLGPMPGSVSQWVSGTLATSRMEGWWPPNSARIARLTLGGSSSSGKGASSRNGVLGSYGRDNQCAVGLRGG